MVRLKHASSRLIGLSIFCSSQDKALRIGQSEKLCLALSISRLIEGMRNSSSHWARQPKNVKCSVYDPEVLG